jgi:hypothetical protein
MIGIGLGLMLRKSTVGPAPFSPLDLAPVAWFRGDVGSTSSWTDQSGNGHDAPAGGTTPATTTLGGQAAFDMAGGASFVNTTSSLVTAGSIYTVIAVAQAGDATGGCLFALRRTTPEAGSLLFTIGVTTYAYSDGVASTHTISSVATEVQSPFWSMHAYAGSGVDPAIYIAGTQRLGAGNQGTESGSTGFVIGNNAAAQGWNYKIGELIIVARALTAPERASLATYVNARYGI